jgi:hypothetical protein
MENKITKKMTLLASILFVLFFFFVLIFIFFLRFSSPVKTIQPTSFPTPTSYPSSMGLETNYPTPTSYPSSMGLETNYSNFNLIVPGKSTLADVEKINGAPSSSSVIDNKTYLYYQTPFKELFNKVLLVNNVVVYAQEAVFSNYRGDYNSFTQSLGQPDFTIYNDLSPLSSPLYVFLKHGVVVQSVSNDITGIIYFTPQDKINFINNIANDLGLSENTPLGQPEFVNPEP